MNTKSIFAAVILAAAISPAAFAADGAQTAAAPAASAAAVTATAQALNLPNVSTVTIADFVAHYKTMLEVQMELSKN